MDAYEVIGVPEVWVLSDRSLKIFLLQDEHYVTSIHSRLFPKIDIPKLVPQLIQQALEIGTSAMLREFRLGLSNT